MCIAVSPKNVAENCGVLFEISAISPTAACAGFGKIGRVRPSPISLLHSMPCSTMNAVPNAMVASSQLRVHERSPRCAANTAMTMVSELDSRQPVMMVELIMLCT